MQYSPLSQYENDPDRPRSKRTYGLKPVATGTFWFGSFLSLVQFVILAMFYGWSRFVPNSNVFFWSILRFAVSVVIGVAHFAQVSLLTGVDVVDPKGNKSVAPYWIAPPYPSEIPRPINDRDRSALEWVHNLKAFVFAGTVPIDLLQWIFALIFAIGNPKQNGTFAMGQEANWVAFAFALVLFVVDIVHVGSRPDPLYDTSSKFVEMESTKIQ